MVPGILLLLLGGSLAIGVPELAHRELLAILFGIGAALTLDESARWLHLQDLHWAKQGRQSLDGIVIAATLAGSRSSAGDSGRISGAPPAGSLA